MKAGVLAAGLLLGFGSSAAFACDLDTPGGSVPVNGKIGGVLVETIEQTEIGLGDNGQPERHANATERGSLTVACGSLASFQGRMMVHAESWIPVLSAEGPLLGAGPITGTFHIFPDVGNGSVKGVLEGNLDFSPTHPTPDNCYGYGCPWVLAQGTWKTAGKNPTGGGFAGLALVPFPCGDGLCYMDPTGTVGPAFTPIPLTPDELVPAPSAKFVINLFQ